MRKQRGRGEVWRSGVGCSGTWEVQTQRAGAWGGCTRAAGAVRWRVPNGGSQGKPSTKPQAGQDAGALTPCGGGWVVHPGPFGGVISWARHWPVVQHPSCPELSNDWKRGRAAIAQEWRCAHWDRATGQGCGGQVAAAEDAVAAGAAGAGKGKGKGEGTASLQAEPQWPHNGLCTAARDAARSSAVSSGPMHACNSRGLR